MENFNQKKQKKSKGLILFLLLIIVVVAALAGYYFLKINTARYAFEMSIDKLLSYEITEQNYKTVKATFDINAKINSEQEELENIADLINDAKLTVTSAVDTEKKEEVVGLKLTKSKDKLIDAKAKIEEENKTMYITLGELFDKTIKVDYEEALEDEMEVKDAKISSIGKITNPSLAQEIMKKEIKSQIHDKYLSMEKVDNFTKNEIKLSSEEFLNIVKTILNDLSNNEEFLSCYENKDEFKDTLKDAMDSIDEIEPDEDINIILDIYTSGIMKKVEKVDFSIDKSGNQTTIQITKIEDGKYSYKITSENEENIEGEVKLNIQNKDFSIEMPIKYEDIEFTLNINGSISYDEELEKINTKKAVSLDELTEEDTNEILNNFLESKLYEIIGDAIGSSYSEYELDNDDYTLDIDEVEEDKDDEEIDDEDENEKEEEENDEDEENKKDKSAQKNKSSSTSTLKTEDGDEIIFNIPKGFKLESEDGDCYKAFIKEDDAEINVGVSVNHETMNEYFDSIEEKAKKYEKNKEYTNIELTERKHLKIAENEFEKVTLSYDKEIYSVTSYVKTYIAHKIDSNNIYTIEIDGADLISDEDIETFLTIENNK